MRCDLQCLEQWLREHPEQSIELRHYPEGISPFGTRVFTARLKKSLHSKMGWTAKTLPELVQAIVSNAP